MQNNITSSLSANNSLPTGSIYYHTCEEGQRSHEVNFKQDLEQLHTVRTKSITGTPTMSRLDVLFIITVNRA